MNDKKRIKPDPGTYKDKAQRNMTASTELRGADDTVIPDGKGKVSSASAKRIKPEVRKTDAQAIKKKVLPNSKPNAKPSSKTTTKSNAKPSSKSKHKSTAQSASNSDAMSTSATAREPISVTISEQSLEDAKQISPYLTTGSEDISVPLTAESIASFQIYAAMLREWNEKMNLTNILDDQGIAIRHFIDSLTLVCHIEEEERKKGAKLSLIDVGTGAGFPGIPLKVTCPFLELTLLDSLKKRIGFLTAVCDELHLDNVTTIHARAEEASRNKQYREKYDIATARAVASLPTLCEYCLPFVKVGGIFLAMKGRADEEIDSAKKAIVTLGGTIETLKSFVLPGTDMHRSVVVIRKIRPTPAQYPRQGGKPDKEPIV